MIGATCLSITAAFVRQELDQRGLGGASRLPILGTLGEFQLTNQLGKTVTLASLRGQVCVFDIIFSRCPGPCALITRHMAALQKAMPEEMPVRFLSLTTDADFDTPGVLKIYGDRFGVDHDRFLFLTGSKLEIHRVATSPRGGLMLAVVEKQPSERLTDEDLFIHSTRFVVVDKQGRIRAFFDGERPEVQPEIISTVRRLARENMP